MTEENLAWMSLGDGEVHSRLDCEKTCIYGCRRGMVGTLESQVVLGPQVNAKTFPPAALVCPFFSSLLPRLDYPWLRSTSPRIPRERRQDGDLLCTNEAKPVIEQTTSTCCRLADLGPDLINSQPLPRTSKEREMLPGRQCRSQSVSAPHTFVRPTSQKPREKAAGAVVKPLPLKTNDSIQVRTGDLQCVRLT